MKARGFRRGLYRLARLGVRQKLYDDPEVQVRLAALEQFRALNQTHGIPVREAAELIGVPLANLYRWRKRYRANRVGGLRSRSRRPRRCPRRRWSPELTRRLIQLRKQYPSWGKRKLTVLLQREGYAVSESTVGRRISDLLRRGRIARSPRRARRERLPRTRPWAKRGWGGLVKTVGKVVQIDTMTVTPHYGFRFKQFTAVDVASRYLVGALYARATATCAARFLDQVLARMPFPVRAVQVDGGGEFCAEFERACQERSLPLIVLPPRSPKMNSRVEYVHGTCRREFYECTEMAADLEGARRQWSVWEDTYNWVRPHESLDLKTPIEYITRQSSSRACSHMS